MAGVVTALAPCILPVLPIVLAGGAQQGRWRPWGIIVGVVLSFSIFTLMLSWLVTALGLSPNASRIFGIAILLLLGGLMLVPAVLERFESWVSSRLSRTGVPVERHGFGGGFVLGLSLGAVWTPCAGPLLASVITLAANGEIDGQVIGATLAYALGSALPMGGIAALGQRLTVRLRWFKVHGRQLQQGFGALLILVAVLMWLGVDRDVQGWLVEYMPNWLDQLQGWERGLNAM
ncbi:MAG: cytochrome c biogenesis CcdA family protein [Patescibacteria group bacterium]